MQRISLFAAFPSGTGPTSGHLGGQIEDRLTEGELGIE
jgi:hypothetical protein